MRFIAHPAIYVALYLVLMLPTYFLPYLGSNSAVLNTAGLASGVGMHPLTTPLICQTGPKTSAKIGCSCSMREKPCISGRSLASGIMGIRS